MNVDAVQICSVCRDLKKNQINTEAGIAIGELLTGTNSVTALGPPSRFCICCGCDALTHLCHNCRPVMEFDQGGRGNSDRRGTAG